LRLCRFIACLQEAEPKFLRKLAEVMYSVQHIRWKPLIIFLAVTLGTGTLANLLTQGSMETYQQFQKPPLSPPAIVFPIVWTILFILMGISAYQIYVSGLDCRRPALIVFGVQLAFNFLWSIFFFNLRAYLFAFIWLILLWALVLAMILLFYRCRRSAALLQIPYLLWVTFAVYLSYSVWMLNR
jgi:benzodiazapine receptor